MRLNPINITLAIASTTHAAASLDAFRALGSGFGRYNPIAVIAVGLGIITVIGFFVLLEIRSSNLKRREAIAIGWQYFAETSVIKGLNLAEKELLRRIAEIGLITSADMIFESASIYDESLEEWLKVNATRMHKDETLWAVLHGIRIKLGYARLPSEVPLTSTRQFQEGSPVLLKVSPDTTIKGSIAEVSEKIWLVSCEDISALGGSAEVEVNVLRPGDGEYQVRVPVLALRHGAGTLQFGHTREIKRKQLRSWVRIDVNIPCRISIISPPEQADEDEMSLPIGLVLEGRMLDLSGGGTCVRFPSPIPQGHKLIINFDLPGASLRGVEALVIRMAPSRRNGREDFEHNIKFSGIETALQEKIVRYIFDKHRLDTQTRQSNAKEVAKPG
jgi:hypothetical protein